MREKGMELIGKVEGCRRDPYHCPSDVLTVGIGSTEAGGEPINPNKRYSDKEIAKRWAKDIQNAEQCVNRYANGAKLTQGQFEALTSLTFNVGCGRLKHSTIYRLAREGKQTELCNEFRRWIYAGGKPLQGLINRRERERDLCLTGE
ncbi:lysozyme [Pasteurellaceae bacterium TAE3-ERU1]|nr:lysozyme [Pasteurellaceae bacterium TAE3-ERU1]